jgi:hypothetical protein
MTCGYAVDGLGFYYIPHSAPIKPRAEAKTATICVIEGEMTAVQVKTEMERLVPGKTNWVIQEIATNKFKTVFPTKSELNRMIEWGMVQTKDRKAKMVIEECGGGSSIKQVMRKVWVQMAKLPSEFRDFLTIWAVGTILGVTKDVDMPFTRQHNRARLQVLVLDPALIPISVDVVIGDNVYELHFKVEPEEIQDSPRLLEMDDDNDEVDRKEDESAGEEGGRDYMQEDVARSSDNVGAGPDFFTKSNRQLASKKSSNKIDHTVVHSSMMEEAMEQQEHTEEEEYVGDMEGMENVEEMYNEMTSSEVDAPGSEPVTPRAETHRELAAISEVGTPSRRSKRRADTADEPSLERAERIKATCNLDFNPKKGTLQGNILAPVLVSVGKERSRQGDDRPRMPQTRNGGHGDLCRPRMEI